jgi:hypothetical protein
LLRISRVDRVQLGQKTSTAALILPPRSRSRGVSLLSSVTSPRFLTPRRSLARGFPRVIGAEVFYTRTKKLCGCSRNNLVNCHLVTW